MSQKKSTTKRARRAPKTPETLTARLRELFESDKLTDDQGAALMDAIVDLPVELDINVTADSEIAAASFGVALRDCPDDRVTKRLVDVVQRIDGGDKFKGFLKRKRAEEKKHTEDSREHFRIKELRERRSEFFTRILQSRKRGNLAAWGIAENSIGLFETHPRGPFQPDDILLISTSGNWWDAVSLHLPRDVPKGKSIIGRLVAHGQLAPVWSQNGDDASNYMESGSLKIQKALF